MFGFFKGMILVIGAIFAFGSLGAKTITERKYCYFALIGLLAMFLVSCIAQELFML